MKQGILKHRVRFNQVIAPKKDLPGQQPHRVQADGHLKIVIGRIAPQDLRVREAMIAVQDPKAKAAMIVPQDPKARAAMIALQDPRVRVVMTVAQDPRAKVVLIAGQGLKAKAVLIVAQDPRVKAVLIADKDRKAKVDLVVSGLKAADRAVAQVKRLQKKTQQRANLQSRIVKPNTTNNALREPVTEKM